MEDGSSPVSDPPWIVPVRLDEARGQEESPQTDHGFNLHPYYAQTKEKIMNFFEQIFMGIVVSILLFETSPALNNYMDALTKFLECFKRMLSKNTRIELIKLCYLLLTKENQTENIRWKSELLLGRIHHRDLNFLDLQLEWEPLYRVVLRLRSSHGNYNGRTYQCLAKFFTPGMKEEILKETSRLEGEMLDFVKEFMTPCCEKRNQNKRIRLVKKQQMSRDAEKFTNILEKILNAPDDLERLSAAVDTLSDSWSDSEAPVLSNLFRESMRNNPDFFARLAPVFLEKLRLLIPGNVRQESILSEKAIGIASLAAQMFYTSAESIMKNEGVTIEIIRFMIDSNNDRIHQYGVDALCTVLQRLTRTYILAGSLSGAQFNIRTTFPEMVRWHVPNETSLSLSKKLLEIFVFPYFEEIRRGNASHMLKKLQMIQRVVEVLLLSFPAPLDHGFESPDSLLPSVSIFRHDVCFLKLILSKIERVEELLDYLNTQR